MSNPFSRRGPIIVGTPPATMHYDPVEFAAPVGRRVRLATGFSLLVVGVLAVVAVALVVGGIGPAHRGWPATLAPVIAAAVMIPIMLYSRVLGYRLTEHELQVLRIRRVNRIAFDGLQSVEVDPKATAWSVKTFGNDGLGAMVGRFRNRKLGPYQAFVTDTGRAVVLRWPDRCIVVSPDRTEEFAAEIRRRAGLRT